MDEMLSIPLFYTVVLGVWRRYTTEAVYTEVNLWYRLQCSESTALHCTAHPLVTVYSILYY